MIIDHINICAPAVTIESVKDFYCKLFDLDVGFRPTFSRPGYWLYSDGKPIIHLTESNKHIASLEHGYLDHVAFSHSGLKNIIDKLNSLDVIYSTSYVAVLDVTQVFFKDPAGIKIEVDFKNEML